MCLGCINFYLLFLIIDVVKVNCDFLNVFVFFKIIFKKKNIYLICKSIVKYFLLNIKMVLILFVLVF